jgi:membrane associated rhomboid family serine protease
MIPLSDDNPTRSFPIITILLIALNIAVYVLQVTSGWQFDGCYEMVPYKISTGHDIVGLLSITRMGNLVLHHVPDSPLFSPQGNQIYLGPSLHIGGNMLYLWIFGNNIEDVLGKVRFLFFYLVCGVVAALTQIAADPLSYIPTLGASGAIAGVLGAYLVLFPGARVNTFVPLIFVWIIRLPAFLLLGFWFALQYMSAQDAAGAPSMGGVAYFAHVGGFIAGVVIIAVLGGRSLIRPRRTLYRGGR